MTIAPHSAELMAELGLERQENPESIEQRLVSFVETHFAERENLGKGKTAEVWIGQPPEFKKGICIKTAWTMGESVNSLSAEFRLQQQFQEAGLRIPRPLAYIEGQGSTLMDGFIAMEVIEGQTLEDWIIERATAGKKISQAEYERMHADLAHQIQLAHQARLYHRDLHLRNVMVTPEGQIVLIDFGDAARVFASEEETDIYHVTIPRQGRFERVRKAPDETALTKFEQRAGALIPKA